MDTNEQQQSDNAQGQPAPQVQESHVMPEVAQPSALAIMLIQMNTMLQLMTQMTQSVQQLVQM